MIKKITVLIVDDSPVIRNMLQLMLSDYEDISVVGMAEDPFDARDKIKQLNPDVLTLDVEMPKMDGLSFLEKIMALRPMPVVMVSTLTGKGTEAAIDALHKGAVDCIAKPNVNSEQDVQNFSAELVAKIRVAAISRVRKSNTPKPVQNEQSQQLRKAAPKLIAIGASTGGVEALSEVLVPLPKETPPIVITQHMPAGFTASFSNRLSGACAIDVVEGRSGMILKPGLAIVAPGAMHMRVVKLDSKYAVQVVDEEKVNNHKPSVDVLLHSVAKIAGYRALGMILTGMGKDGAEGLLAMSHSGAHTIGQDEDSSVVYGMPKAAYDIGAVKEVLPLTSIANRLMEHCFYEHEAANSSRRANER